MRASQISIFHDAARHLADQFEIAEVVATDAFAVALCQAAQADWPPMRMQVETAQRPAFVRTLTRASEKASIRQANP